MKAIFFETIETMSEVMKKWALFMDVNHSCSGSGQAQGQAVVATDIFLCQARSSLYKEASCQAS